MKKKYLSLLCAMTITASMVTGACVAYAEENDTQENTEVQGVEIEIALSDDGIAVDGMEISSDSSAAVYAGAEIVYYKSGQDALYGEGDEDDGHTEEEAAENTVITITEPGTYRVTGSISKGQIAIDLGEDSREDESAVVNLILDQADITCTVAPAIVVYNAYECGSDDTETATKDVDTTGAGFNLILADGSENTVTGSHVAKIYKEGTTQEDIDAGEAKKQWKFDAAIDSLVSFNINGEEQEDGKLKVTADNEGISSALHMTVNGGEIEISASDDSINTSEDEVSVFTMNDGVITCNSGLGKEGDGIDSNGWIVFNGGYTIACANPDSQDSGIDSDMGIYINGGTVLASGNMYDEVSSESEQTFMVFSFNDKVEANQLLMLKDSKDEAVAAFSAANSFTTMVYSSDMLEEGDYTLYRVSSVTGNLNGSIYTDIIDYEGEVQLQYSSTGMMGFGGGFGGQRGQGPDGMENGERPELPEGAEAGEMPEPPEGVEAGEMPELPEGVEAGEMPEPPEGTEAGEMPELPEGVEAGEIPENAQNGARKGGMGKGQGGETLSEPSTAFTVSGIQNLFSQITEVE